MLRLILSILAAISFMILQAEVIKTTKTGKKILNELKLIIQSILLHRASSQVREDLRRLMNIIGILVIVQIVVFFFLELFSIPFDISFVILFFVLIQLFAAIRFGVSPRQEIIRWGKMFLFMLLFPLLLYFIDISMGNTSSGLIHTFGQFINQYFSITLNSNYQIVLTLTGFILLGIILMMFYLFIFSSVVLSILIVLCWISIKLSNKVLATTKLNLKIIAISIIVINYIVPSLISYLSS